DLAVLDIDVCDTAVRQLAEQNLVRERRFERALDESRHRPRAHRLVVAMLDEPVDRRRADLERHLLLLELALELVEELAGDLADHLDRERAEEHGGIEAVAELGREHALERLLAVLGVRDRVAKADAARRHLAAA